ncbi:MAG: hypothetical protein VB076_03590 [Synergistaceae bacterium]|nr:hypothetical protein [Synergistaceae bacterium]
MPQQIIHRRRLRLTFDGKKLSDHEIDVDVFASSLLSLSDLIKTSHAIAFEDEVDCQFKLTAIKPNCISSEFIITCVTCAGAAGYVLFKNDWETSWNQLLKNLGFIKTKTLSLPTFYKKLKKRKIIDVEFVELEGEDIVILHCNDGSTFSVPYDLYKLIQNKKIRDDQYKLLKPLEQKGISTITYLAEIDNEWIPANEINHDELDLFLPDVIEESPQIEEFTVQGSLDRPSLQGENGGWKIIDTRHGKTYKFKITDAGFLSMVRKNEIPFVGSDTFRVRMRSITPPPSENKRTQYEGIEITQVNADQKSLFS